jgi:UDP-glucose 4-epimerase
VRALDYLHRDGESGAFNLGTGSGFSVREIADAVSHVTNSSVPLIESPRREGDPPILIADTRRANAVLGWHPRHSGLDSIVRTALAWERSKAFALAAE